jgi:hypothetical protein
VRWKNREIKTLSSKNGLPCDAVASSIRDAHATLWLYATCGVIAIADAELERWWQQPDTTIQWRLLDALDGAMPGMSTFQPAVSRSPDGRLWFVNDTVVQMLAPDGVRTNPVAPPVLIEGLRADRGQHAVGGLVSLPARTRDIEIGYTALSFIAPEKVRFRYKLEGRDLDWQDGGTRRQVFYSDLAPGRYRFNVTAANDDGVWNALGATVDFAIAPAYYQTVWFMGLAAATILTLAWTAHRVRLHIVEKHGREITALNERLMNAQEQERIRIAGELHDGVMQEMLAVTMMLGTAKRRSARWARRSVSCRTICTRRPCRTRDCPRRCADTARTSTTIAASWCRAMLTTASTTCHVERRWRCSESCRKRLAMRRNTRRPNASRSG